VIETLGSEGELVKAEWLEPALPAGSSEPDGWTFLDRKCGIMEELLR
jgi:hypothetical protein